MKRSTRTMTLPALIVAAALTLGACGTEEDFTTSPAGEAVGQDDTAGAEAHNEADVEFATGMIPHHAQAIQMADMALEQEDSSLTELAQQIQAAQDPEIETMSRWLAAWGEEVPEVGGGHDMGSMGGMEGMMSEGDMDSLMAMNGPDFDRMWLEMMIEHHEGAIAMAEAEIADGQHVEAKDLAQEIVDTQQAEIDQMRGMLTSLTG